MSWTSRLGNLGRFSPFMRSPSADSGKVSDADFSYITADDLRRHVAEGKDLVSSSPSTDDSRPEREPERETDLLVLRYKKKEYPVHFPAFSIAKGELTVGAVRDAAAKKTGTGNPSRIKMIYKGRTLKDDAQLARSGNLHDGSEILVTIADINSVSPSESDFDDDSQIDAIDGSAVDGEGARRKRNRGKKTKRREKREAAAATAPSDSPRLGVPLSQASARTASPRPTPTPATPHDKLDALSNTLASFTTDVNNFRSTPPTDPSKREFEHKKLSETILTQVLLKLDAVETDGDQDARTRRKELVRQTQALLQDLDASMR